MFEEVITSLHFAIRQSPNTHRGPPIRHESSGGLLGLNPSCVNIVLLLKTLWSLPKLQPTKGSYWLRNYWCLTREFPRPRLKFLPDDAHLHWDADLMAPINLEVGQDRGNGPVR